MPKADMYIKIKKKRSLKNTHFDNKPSSKVYTTNFLFTVWKTILERTQNSGYECKTGKKTSKKAKHRKIQRY